MKNLLATMAPVARTFKSLVLGAALKTAKFAPKVLAGTAAAVAAAAVPAVTVTSCTNPAGHEESQFEPSVGNHGGVNFFIENGVDRDAFISEIQAIMEHPSSA